MKRKRKADHETKSKARAIIHERADQSLAARGFHFVRTLFVDLPSIVRNLFTQPRILWKNPLPLQLQNANSCGSVNAGAAEVLDAGPLSVISCSGTEEDQPLARLTEDVDVNQPSTSTTPPGKNGDLASGTKRRTFECPRCKRTFPSQETCCNHIRTGCLRPFHCTICEKRFDRRWNLDVHIKRHTGERPYNCDYEGCGKSFIQRINLVNHKWIHTDNKPFHCNHVGCGKVFGRRDRLESHKRIHSGKRPFRCDYAGCIREFAHRNALVNHTRFHTGARPYRCDHPGCEQSFSRRDTMVYHKRTHKGKQPSR